MSGIYIHIPFCSQRCIYCDFYSTTNLKQQTAYVQAVLQEAKLRSNYLNQTIKTLYFGGGTPSQLQPEAWHLLLNGLCSIFDLSAIEEFTVECNPDDMDEDYIKLLQSLGVNRLSFGVQSFNDDELIFLNRRHNAQQAIELVGKLQKNGFLNISMDLMFALPNQTIDSWNRTLDIALSLNVQHISAYSLMYEGRTRLVQLRDQGKIVEMNDEKARQLFELLIERTSQAGLQQYEISNFALPGYASLHNSSYWKGIPYLGLGASAHSYNGDTRQWNISHLKKYIEGVNQASNYYEIEHLSPDDSYNEYVMTGLRTESGISLKFIRETFGEERLSYLLKNAQISLDNELLVRNDSVLKLTKSGIYVSDSVMSDLMYI